MELFEYPRPTNDTGIGIHWAPGYATAIGIVRIRDQWLPELRSLGVKWVKIYHHDSALDFAELLLAENIIPIVRIYRPTPNPGRLGVREIVHVDSLVRAGVRYFEVNSEPDRDAEWKGGRVPANGLELVAEDAIANLELILERGGMPAIPALSNGSQWDLVGKIVAKGRRDLFDGPVWQAIHNYMRNRPLDFPYDIGNQEGAAYTDRFYRTVADERWEENAWRGRGLADVNRLRLDRCSPGMTIQDDHACWLAFEHFDALNRRHLGRSLPIIATESGYLVGEDTDPRYPATTPNLHMAQTLEACRVLMGVSHRFPTAPDYLFCACFCIIANNDLGGSSTWWEKFAWYSPRWSGGRLPIVRALQGEPKVIRKWQGGSGQTGPLITLRGAVIHARGQHTVVLERNDLQIASVQLDANSRYELPNLPVGAYTLRIEGSDLAQPVILSSDQREVVINLDLGAPEDAVARSVVSGMVAGGAGAVVLLVRSSDGEEWVTIAKDDGSFRFVELPAGLYNIRVSGDGSRVDQIALDGRNQVEVKLAVAGWGHTIRTAEAVAGVGAIRCRVVGRKGVMVQAHTFSASSEPVRTGESPDFGEDECQINGLDVGLYIVSASGLSIAEGRVAEAEARVTVDKRRIPLVEFVYNEAGQPSVNAQSIIEGRVVGGGFDTRAVRVRLLDSQANSREVEVNSTGAFIFDGLAAGVYTVQVVGHESEATRSDISLDGVSHAHIELLLPLAPRPSTPNQTAGRSIIVGHAPGSAGRLARLVDAVGNERQQVVGLEDRASFERLLAGVYTLSIEGGYVQSDLRVDGNSGLEVFFAPLTSGWEAAVSSAGPMPGYSVVRVEVQGRKNIPVYIWKDDWQGMMRRSGSSPELGEYALEFGPLGPGLYMIEPEGLGIYIDVELSGLEAKWVSFRPASQPSSPNTIRPLTVADVGRSDAPAQTTKRSTYLWIEDGLFAGAALLALLRYCARMQPEVGNDLERAAQADEVILVQSPGYAETLAAVERMLIGRGVKVRPTQVENL
jgi:hypothetical protein